MPLRALPDENNSVDDAGCGFILIRSADIRDAQSPSGFSPTLKNAVLARPVSSDDNLASGCA